MQTHLLGKKKKTLLTLKIDDTQSKVASAPEDRKHTGDTGFCGKHHKQIKNTHLKEKSILRKHGFTCGGPPVNVDAFHSAWA